MGKMALRRRIVQQSAARHRGFLIICRGFSGSSAHVSKSWKCRFRRNGIICAFCVHRIWRNECRGRGRGRRLRNGGRRRFAQGCSRWHRLRWRCCLGGWRATRVHGCNSGGCRCYLWRNRRLKPAIFAVGTAHLAAVNPNGIVRDSITCAAGWTDEQHLCA